MTSNLLDEMLKSIGKDVAVYQEYILKENKVKNTVCYFIEGKDNEYYHPRVKQYANLGENDKCWFLSCDGKKNVIGVRNLIVNNTFDETNRRLFFVDNDYGLEEIPEDIYRTDYYSIENFYLNKNVVMNALENILGVCILDENFSKAIEYFEKIYDEYSKFAVKINSFFYTVRKNEKENGYLRTDLNIKKLNFFVENEEMDKYKLKDLSYEELIKLYKVKFEMDLNEIEINSKLFCLDNHSNFRGKFELDLLKWFLETTKKNIKYGNLGFCENTNLAKVDFYEFTMGLLSIYAYTPDKLIEYIKKNT